MAKATGLRAEQAQDGVFLRGLYASTRAADIALAGWDAAMAEAFVRMQFDAQRRHFRQQYPNARFDVVELDGAPVGRLYVARAERALHVIDISLVPAQRGQGLGSALLRSLQDEAARAGQAVTLHVDVNNPAQALYQRLGFREICSSGMYREMAWQAVASAVPA